MRARFAVLLALVSVIAAHAQSPEPQTLADCLKAAREYVGATYKAERSAGRTPDVAALTRRKAELARQYAARFPIDGVSGEDLLTLARLHAEGGNFDMAGTALAKRLETPGLSDAQRATALAAGVDLSMTSPVTDAGLQRAEEYAAALDQLASAALPRLEAHSRLGGYFRAIDVDEKILVHMDKVLSLVSSVASSERQRLGFRLMNAYTSVAEVQAGRGRTDEALAVLNRGLKDLSEVPGAQKELAAVVERYRLVGKPGAAVDAPDWLNAPPGTTRLEPAGRVTLVQFTAHWCGPCRKSYPAMIRLHEQFAARGLRTIFSTQLYGFYEKQQQLSAADEIAADRQYFVEHHQVTFPIAIEPQRVPRAGSDGSAAPTGRVFTEDKYFVSGIPHIVVLDRKGIVRRILVGWDPAAEAGVAKLVGELLSEK